MRTASVWVIKQFAPRFFGRVSLTLFMLCLAQAAAAQQAVPMSPSVVLVLKLVSSTHVKPTTGIVVSDNGLVLVPREFASTDGEMIVLDGGTDILSNGRPAKIVAQILSANLAILSVEGLKRPGITLADNALTAAGRLHLEAFPPAEYIAKGAQPLWIAFDILGGQAGVQQTVSPETPLPYVSGAIIDDCGYLAGISLTDGAQSLETGKTPLIIFKDELDRAFGEMQITLPVAKCMPLLQQAETPTQAQKQVQERDTNETEAAEPESPEPLVDESLTVNSQGTELEPPRQVTINAGEPPSIWRSIPIWLPVLGIIILVVFIWKAVFFFRIRENAPEQKNRRKVNS